MFKNLDVFYLLHHIFVYMTYIPMNSTWNNELQNKTCMQKIHQKEIRLKKTGSLQKKSGTDDSRWDL